MKRLGIIAFYDQEGIVDRSAEYLLNSLLEALDKILIIVNGLISDDSYRKLVQYSDTIICRENIGYDGGAYQDIFLYHLSREMVLEYDEIVLLNNTFYGPFYPWSYVFKRMEQMQVDFWGLSKRPKYYSRVRKRTILEYIHSYFLVFNRRLFSDNVFWAFWEEMKPIRNFNDAMENFEFSLTPFFSNAGFQYAVYTDFFPECEFLKIEDVVYNVYCYDLLKCCRFPVIKKRDGISVFNPQTQPALDYIEKHYDYDLQMLWENAYRTLKKARLFTELEPFYHKYKSMYLYGSGIIAQEIERYFEKKEWKINGYIETEPHVTEKNGKPVIAWNNFHMTEDVGIIVALSRKNTEEVEKYLPKSEAIMLLY